MKIIKLIFFKLLSQFIFKYCILVFILSLSLFIISINYTFKNLTFNPSRDDLIGEGEEFRRLSTILVQEFDEPGDIVVVVEGGKEEDRQKFIEDLALNLKHKNKTFTDIFYKLDLRFLKKKGFLFLPKTTIEKIARQVEAAKPLYKTIAKSEELSGLLLAILNEVQESEKTLDGPSGFLEFIPTLEGIYLQMAQTLKGSVSYIPVWDSPVSEKEENQAKEIPDVIYSTLQGRKIYILTVKPILSKEDFSPVHDAVIKLRSLVKTLAAKYPSLKIGITGEPILEDDEMVASKNDSTKATILSLIIITILFTIGFRSVKRPVLAVVTLVTAIGWTLGFATFAVGHLNLLTVTFLPMIMGLGIDFGIQLIARYEEELPKAQNPLSAMESALTSAGNSILTAGSTNAMGFFAAILTPFKGIRELGIIAGGGILLCLLGMVVLLPSLLFIFDKANSFKAKEDTLSNTFYFPNIENKLLKYPKQITALGVFLTLLLLMAAFLVKFDYNLLNLQSRGLESVTTELRLIANTDKSVLYASIITASLEKASQLKQQLEKLPTVANVESPTIMLPNEYKDKLALARMMYKHLLPVDFNKPSPEIVNLHSVIETSKKLREEFDSIYNKILKLEEFQIADSVLRLVSAIDKMLNEAERVGQETASRRLAMFQQTFFNDLKNKFARLKQEVSHPITPKDLPPPLRKRFLSKSGKLYMLQVFPKENIWERNAQERFIKELRTVSIDVTGTPITMYEYVNLLIKSYKTAGIYAVTAVIILFIFHFRQPMSVCLVMIPLITGFIWMLGVMGILKITFNPANFVTLPLLVGIGVANGIYVVKRFQEEGAVHLFYISTGKAILLSALTSIAGFGSLMLASHQGIASLGLIMTLGIAATLIATLILLPAILQLFKEHQLKE